MWLQLRREDSVPVHLTSSRSIGPVPRPNVAEDIATGATENHHLYISRYSCLINMPEYISKVAMCTWLLIMHNYPSFTLNTVQISTWSRKSQLSAHNPGIIGIPVIITHCSPHSIDADLHSACTLQRSINQTHCSISATLGSCIYKKTKNIQKGNGMPKSMQTR